MLPEFEEIKNLINSKKLKLYNIEKYIIKKLDPEFKRKVGRKYELEGKEWKKLSRNWEKACNTGAEYRRRYVKGSPKLKTNHSFFNLTPPNMRIENPIGTAKIKVKKVKPIPVHGITTTQSEKEHASREYTPYLAIPERTLKALNYGSKVIRKSGKKITSIVTKDAMTRSILLKTEKPRKAHQLEKWIRTKEPKVQEIVYESDKHHKCRLTNLNTWQIGSRIYLRLSANTKDAMGMNMLTQASDEVGCWIQQNSPEEYQTVFETVSANMCADKKPAAINHILGRGKTVSSTVKIGRKDLESYHLTPTFLFNHVIEEDWENRQKPASRRTKHALNVITGYFIHGQDLAQTIESSNCQKHINLIDKNTLEYTTELSSLEIATFGGGSTTPSAQKYLQKIECKGANKAEKLAEIISGTVLTAELGQDLRELKLARKNPTYDSDYAEIPVGIAGLLKNKYVQLGTTETALVGAVNAGLKAIRENRKNYQTQVELLRKYPDGSKKFKIHTELEIPNSYFKNDSKHKTSTLSIANLLREKCWDGSGKAGGYYGSENTNIGNSIAALNTAYGQPINFIRQNSQGSIMGEISPKQDLTFRLILPQVRLKTSGELPEYAIDSLKRINSYGEGKEEKLAREIYAPAVTALELRTTWTQAAGTLAGAHTNMTKN